MRDMLLGNLEFSNQDDFMDHFVHQFRDRLNEEARRFYKYINIAKTTLHPGCTRFAKLSFIMETFYLKC